jgi:hypothetical protein
LLYIHCYPHTQKGWTSNASKKELQPATKTWRDESCSSFHTGGHIVQQATRNT